MNGRGWGDRLEAQDSKCDEVVVVKVEVVE